MKKHSKITSQYLQVKNVVYPANVISVEDYAVNCSDDIDNRLERYDTSKSNI